jgi:ribonuclease J
MRFIALSGTISVTENLYIYETENDMMIVDCGVGFPDLEMRGVDLVIPDFSYILKNKAKLRGIVVSQGHEDHIGALPFLLREVNVPVWSSPLVTEFLTDKLNEYKVTGVRVNTFDPTQGSFDIGPFKIYPFRVTHSVPDACGFAIDTPEGRIFHVPEHKMDQDPVDGMPFNIARAKHLAEGHNLFLASDCLGANKSGFTPSERPIEGSILKIVQNAKSTVYFTAISSNIGRFQQAINVAAQTGRKVVYVGRSVQKKCEIAHEIGYLKYPDDLVVDFRQARRYHESKLMYLISGCYGQVGSSLYRLSLNEYDKLQATPGDTLIFSADPAPPYSKESENFVIDNMIDMGVDVHYYDIDEGLYVSGHGSQEDILELFRMVKPKYFIPIGGAVRFMHSYKKLAMDFGAQANEVFTLKPGDSIDFVNGQAKPGESIAVKSVLVDGLGIGDVGRVVLEDRHALSESGFVIAVLKVGKSGKLISDPEIKSKGFVFEKTRGKMLVNASKDLKDYLKSNKNAKGKSLEKLAGNYLEKFFMKKTGRRPLVLPVVVEI